MTQRASSSSFQIVDWHEQTYESLAGGARLSRASVRCDYSGDIEGSGEIEYLMTHTPDGRASFVGIERITGTVLGRSGTAVLQHAGVFSDGHARGNWTVVRGAGSGALQAMHGNGSFVAPHGEAAKVTFYAAFQAMFATTSPGHI